MTYSRIKKIISFTLCLAMFMSFCGCGKAKETSAKKIAPMEPEEVSTYYFDFLGGKDVMPIAGYHGPQTYQYSAKGQKLPDYFSDEFMEMVADCGINIITNNGADYTNSTDKAKRLLDLGEKYKVGIFVRDSTILDNLGDETLSIQELDEQINKYVNHPACVGIYVVDEPGNATYYSQNENRYISCYSKLFQNLNQLGVKGYGNLYPLTSMGAVDVYKNYLQEYIDTCPVGYISYDKYPFVNDNSLTYAHDYFLNLSVVRKAAESADIPFWGFVQSGAQWNDEGRYFDSNGYFPGEGQFMWLVNTTLAYGAKGIQYFPLLQPYWFAYSLTEPFDFERNGLIGAWGNKTQWWYYAQNANKQIAAIDEVLMNSVNKGVIVSEQTMSDHFKDVDYIIKGKSWRELSNVSGEAMIGCFNYNGKSAYYVVNYDTEYAQKIKLDFFDRYDMTVIQKAEKKYINASSLELTMSAGEGVLIVMGDK